MACPKCRAEVAQESFFCPQCGAKLQEPPLPTTILRQVGIYALAVLLPPLGLWPGIKYLRQDNPKAKQIGMAAIALTIVATIATIWISASILNSIGNSFGSLGDLNALGY